MHTSVMGLPATYTTQPEALTGRFSVFCDGRFIGYAESLTDARFAARLHASLLGGATIH